MAKNKNKNRGANGANKNGNGGNGNTSNGNGNGGNAAGSSSATVALFQKGDEASLKLSEVLGDDAPELVTAPTPPAGALNEENRRLVEEYVKDLERCVNDARSAIAIHHAARTRYEKLQDDVREIKSKLEEDEKDLAKRREHLSKQESQLEERVSEVEDRELEAASGFSTKKREVREALKKEIAELEARREEVVREAEEGRSQALAALNEDVRSKREELSGREKDVELRLVVVERKEEKLVRDQGRLDAEWRDLAEEKAQVRCEVEAEMKSSLERQQSLRERAEARLDGAYKTLSEREEQLAEFNELALNMGGKAPQLFLAEFEQYKQKNRDLHRELELLRESHGMEDIELLRSERNALRERVRVLEGEHGAAMAELYGNRVSVLDKERLEGERRALVQHKELLSAHLNELEKKVQEITSSQQSERVFPQLTMMDESKESRSAVPLENVPKLDEFVEILRGRIASAYQGVPLFFDKDDLRLFLGGLAMSQLHILQGMSGTGKTSLVKAFARAVGGFPADIAVQAGWRDKYDLVGHYNAFEKRFYEEECLQALYRAQVPFYQDRINVVLLDEMNLSRPEQYFAEFLSALEKNDPLERQIKLMETAPFDAPKLLVEGRKIRVPENLWFMGTANHDETTNEFADKTQDRSHIMELKKCDPFPVSPFEKGVGYSYSSLRRRFSEAGTTHAKEVNILLAQLNSSKCALTKTLADTCGVAWGNRFAEHSRKFLPVVAAAGGTIEQAFDHLLASRVFRVGKVTGRYDITTKDLNAVEQALIAFWSNHFSDLPVRCLELLHKDAHRKERGA